MWTTLINKWTALAVVAVVITTLIGVLLYKNQSLKLQVAESNVRITELTNQLEDSVKANESFKTAIQYKDGEINAAKEQVNAGNTIVKDYKKRIDKFSDILAKAKCVPEYEKTGVIDEQSNEEVVDALNCLITGSCNQLLPKTDNKN